MVRFQNVLLTIFLGLLVWSCDLKPRSGAVKMDTTFLDLDSLIEVQAELLHGKKFTKIVEQGGQQEQKLQTYDTAAWARELSVFSDININKSAYVGAYEKALSTDGLNAKFTRKPEEKGGPVVVEITRYESGALAQIKGEVAKENVLYEARKEYMLSFDPKTGLINAYEFSGHQKLAVKDQMTFRISGKL